jgi:hypothetical protein
MLTFIETKLFTSLVQQYLADDEYAALQQALVTKPAAGDLIRGSGGVGSSVGVSRVVASAAAFGSFTT